MSDAASLKRYLVFIYYQYYPVGGMNDLEGDFDSLDEAKEFVKNHEDSKDIWNDSVSLNKWHIYDAWERKIVADQEFSEDYEEQKKEDEKAYQEFLNRNDKKTKTRKVENE